MMKLCSRIEAQQSIPLSIVSELPSKSDGELLTLEDLRSMLARGEVITDDPGSPFEMVSRDGSEDKYIIGKRYT